MKMHKVFGTLIGIALVISNVGYGATLNVPSDFQTIQDAVDAASNGDTILVGPGTYYEHITIQDINNLTLIGAGIGKSTIIDYNNPSRPVGVYLSGYNTHAFFDIEGFTLIGNEAGIVLHTQGTSNFSVRNCEILFGNEDDSDDHGIYLTTNSGSVFIENNFISYRYSECYHCEAIILIGVGNFYIQNNTIVNNHYGISHSGGNDAAEQSHLIVKNNIIASNKIGVDSNIHLKTTISYNNAWDNTEGDYLAFDSSISGYLPLLPDPGYGEISADPRFVSNGDFHLDYDSPCIDAGSYVGIYDDIDGEGRPMLSGFDIGADEYSGPIWPRVDLYLIPKWRPIIPNLISSRRLPVAILTSDVFDASEVDPLACEMAGAFPVRWKIKDVDKDGDLDMMIIFKVKDLDLNEDVTEVTFEGETFDGERFFGTLPVNMGPKGNAYGRRKR